MYASIIVIKIGQAEFAVMDYGRTACAQAAEFVLERRHPAGQGRVDHLAVLARDPRRRRRNPRRHGAAAAPGLRPVSGPELGSLTRADRIAECQRSPKESHSGLPIWSQGDHVTGPSS
jgi:hypothetical protein